MTIRRVHEESVRKEGKADVHRALEKDIRPSQWRHAIPANKLAAIWLQTWRKVEQKWRRSRVLFGR
ncbi:MAG TPA: hypothetical protein VGJ30_19755, partial [Candidatus Angelobacter sp.]